MLKKTIALLIIFAMLVPFSSAVAADNTDVTPTIEEILNAYHEIAFAAQTAEDTAGATTWSRNSASGKTLEQETVDELTAAGYEAYNVTADNYESLEASLQTDFASMGLDPASSYIIVISGEEQSANNSSRAADTLLPPHTEDEVGDGGGNPNSSFEYTYGGKTYTLRYVTVTSADVPRYSVADTKVLISASKDSEEINNMLNSALYFGVDAGLPIPLGTIASLLGIEIININLNYNNTLSLIATADWTRTYTQIYMESGGMWYNGSSVDYVKISYWFVGSYVENGVGTQRIDTTITDYRYSENYFDHSLRKSLALRGYVNSTYYHEYVGDVSIYPPGAEFSLNKPTPDPIFYFSQYEGYFP